MYAIMVSSFAQWSGVNVICQPLGKITLGKQEGVLPPYIPCAGNQLR